MSKKKQNKSNPHTIAIPQEKYRSLTKYIIFSIMLFTLILVVGTSAFLYSMQQIIRTNKDNELTKLLELERTRLEVLIDKEIADVIKMSTSPIIRRFFENPDNETLKEMAMVEIDVYRYAMIGEIYWVNDIDKMYYFGDSVPFFVNPEKSENLWYLQTLNETEVFNLNVNYKPDLGLTRLWINAPIIDKIQRIPLGVIGSGIDISKLVASIYSVYEEKNNDFSFYFFNTSGEIVGARYASLINEKINIKNQLGIIGDSVFNTAKNLDSSEIRTFSTEIGQVAVISIPMFDWFAIAILPNNINDFKTPMTTTFIVLMIVIAIILILSCFSVAGLLKPIQEMMVSLEAASKAKSTFLATMSHEIRTPMNAIIGISQIELSKDTLPEEQAIALGKIYDSGNNLLGIINDILDMSKIESGKLEINPVDYDTPSLINDTAQLNMVRIGSKPIEFLLEVDENLPSRMFGDDLRIKQVLNNLLSNAIKYTSAGNVKLTVNHFLSDNGDLMLRFNISDTGQGIKPEDVKKLFSEYTRFNSEANRKTEGTGIGLNITQNLVKLMDGTISVKSEYQKGSTFEVIIKQQAIKCQPIGKELAKKLATFNFSSKKHFANLQLTRELMPYGKVLVVDDVESNLYVAKGLLDPYKIPIDTARSGFEAIDKVNAGKNYDIIFMDHMMPDMDGIETTQKLREQGYKGIIVALTANAIAGNYEMFMKNGFNGFLSKPIDVRQLNVILNKFVRDKYPQEASKCKNTENIKSTTSNSNLQIDPKLLKIVCKDAQKAIETLHETQTCGNIKLFTTTAHAMKSALANIGEKEMSAEALKLENAGRNNDTKFIADNTNNFINSLLTLIDKLSSKKDENKKSDEGISEDITYLTEQITKIKNACENYDDSTAYTALDLLKRKQWKKETTATLEEIHDSLFLHSDFDKATELANKIVQRS